MTVGAGRGAILPMPRLEPNGYGREGKKKEEEEEEEEGNEENDDDDADDDVEEGELDKKSGRARPLSLSRKGGEGGRREGFGSIGRPGAVAKQCKAMRLQFNATAMQ